MPYIEVHAHLQGRTTNGSPLDLEGAAKVALEAMDRLGIQKALVMPPPHPPNHVLPWDYRRLVPIVARWPDRFGLVGGGGTLNPIIHEAVGRGEVTEDMRRRFEEAAQAIIAAGACGFGEMTALHLSFNSQHPFLQAPPDHPLFLRLSELAAEHGMPIDLHMELCPEATPLPRGRRPPFHSPPNPKQLDANLAGFERLLQHNRKARVVWAHVGWDNLGSMTVDRLARLLEAHPNLFMSLKVHWHSEENTRPLDRGRLRDEWCALIACFPDRFCLGADQIYFSPKTRNHAPKSDQASRLILDQLPKDVQRKVATENALRIYRWKRDR